MNRKFLYCVGMLFMLAFFTPSIVYASSMEDDTEYVKSYDYEITNYSVDVKVNEDNSMDITERLEVYYNEPRHGITRKLPIVNQIVRQDGSKAKNRTKISDVMVADHEFTTSVEGNYYEIKIGSENKTVTEFQNYTINYHYDIGMDTGDGFDELYFNLVGTEWDTTIQYVKFSIEMPKKFDENKLGFAVGPEGSTESQDVYYTVWGKKIEGEYYNTLNPEEGVTVRLELPEGYFVSKSNWINSENAPMFLVPAACLFLAFVLWFIFGRDKKAEEKMSCHPPRGYNSLEIGFLYKGKAKGSDVVSLLVYLANKGYLSIEETEEKTLFSSDNECVITKLKEYDGDNECERIFFNDLFAFRSSVTITELQYSFYTTVDKILKKINAKENVHKVMHKITFQKVLVAIGILFSLVVAVSIPTLEIATKSELSYTLLLMAIYTPFYGVFIFGSMQLFARIFMGVFLVVHSGVFFSTLPIVDAVRYEPFYLVGILFTLVCIAGMVVFLKIMPKRTPLGNEIYGEILGFKHFLETSEKSRLEAEILENPTYFYDILPYTYVLGISDAWIKKFEMITLASPHWYHSRSGFHTAAFGTFFGRTMRRAHRSMTCHPSKSSSGGSSGSSGGGCSGGGSGGGGGSSW